MACLRLVTKNRINLNYWNHMQRSIRSSQRCRNYSKLILLHPRAPAVLNIQFQRQVLPQKVNTVGQIPWYPPFSRTLKTSAPLRAIPPIFLLAASKLGKYFAAFFGRQFRVWYRNLPPEEKASYAGRAKRFRTFFYLLLVSMGAGGYYFWNSHLEETPITKRRRFVMFSHQQIDEISQHELDILLDTHRDNILPRTDPRHQKVYRVATRLLEGNKDLLRKHGKDKNWTITVVDNKVANAFVLSCGSIFVFTGLLSICDDDVGDSDSRLAIILGHELSHVLLNHSAEQASVLHILDLILIIPVAIMWAILPSDTTTAVTQWLIGKLTDILVTLPFGRSLEAEADQVGLILSARACFDIRECMIWKKMQLMSNQDIQVEIFSTHPSEESRFESLQQQLPAAIAIREECNCPVLSAFDLEKRIQLLENQFALKKNEELLVPIKLNLEENSANTRTI